MQLRSDDRGSFDQGCITSCCGCAIWHVITTLSPGIILSWILVILVSHKHVHGQGFALSSCSYSWWKRYIMCLLIHPSWHLVQKWNETTASYTTFSSNMICNGRIKYTNNHPDPVSLELYPCHSLIMMTMDLKDSSFLSLYFSTLPAVDKSFMSKGLVKFRSGSNSGNLLAVWL